MVKTIFVSLDDKAFNRINRVKKKLGLTWVEFFIKSGELLKATIKK